ncbi:cysteine-rich receptor-like protein kinase 25 [Curcuma longa]|uniref:cysteine-rich receptor-like protein kinase 25 n=1 Tax=Curcuma longa TaxID=136217 RepID=UPI003D9F7674
MAGSILFFFLSLLLLVFPLPQTITSFVLWNYCHTDANYTTNSSFRSNLDFLLSSLSSPSTAAAGFLITAVGSQPPFRVNGLALCRGDVSSSSCQTCLASAAVEIINNCPNGTRSTICYDDCLLRYSNESFFSVVDTSLQLLAFNVNNATFPNGIGDSIIESLIVSLTVQAFNSPRFFATGTVNISTFQRLYGLVQCTRDLLPEGCYSCLRDMVALLPRCCDSKQGGRVYSQSCFLRFESYPFYHLSAVGAPSGGKSNSSGRRILFIAISVAASLLLLCAIFIYRRRTKATTQRRKLLTAKFKHEDQHEIKGAESLLFDLEAIRIATDNFSDRNKLGEGGFGPVYKGTLENGEHVAVKRLSRNSGQGLDELKNEVFLVAKLRHRNLVRLLGCCLESEEKLLVYNYLANTSLDKFLFDNSKREKLDWARRFKIIEGISRGLLYLHEDSPLKIIHRDLKASNILLDANMDPKISDFGLAKLFGADETQGNTKRIAGTFGYMAPEYTLHGLFSVKSDVYSYGVLILEILTGQKNSGYRGSEYPIELVTHMVWRHWTQGNVLQVIDQDLVEQCQTQQISRCIHIGLLCVQQDPIQRPTMANVVFMLNNHFVGLPTPSAPAFLSNSNTTSESNGIPRRENSNGSKGILMKISENNVSVSVLEPR